jgi:hypothetical protein
MKKLKNTTATLITHIASGYDLEPSIEVEFPENEAQIMCDIQLFDLIDSGDVIVIAGTQELSPEIGKSYFCNNSIALNSSLALDKDATDQSLTGIDWIEVTHQRIIWDVNGDYDGSVDDFVVPIDGIYKFDCKMRIKNIADCDEIELAIFKRDTPDDYWFIIDRKYPAAENLSEVILSGAITFDFYQYERYCIKIKMVQTSGGTVAADIDGDDDFTAWGYDFSKKL